MKKAIFVLLIAVFVLHHAAAQNEVSPPEYKNVSLSFDPITLIGLFLYDDDDEVDFRNLWFGTDINWETESQREMGVGLFLGVNRATIAAKYRFFYNKERQSGFFWGLFGLVEWRMLYWFYDNSELGIGWSFPFTGHDNIYHSIGITGGVDIGFRFRTGNFGITPYFGLGVPLYYTFGDLPPKKDTEQFDLLNTSLRAIRIGLMLDFFK